MPTIIKKFQYSGLLNTFTIPAGATSVDMYLWGGAGAGGGQMQEDREVQGRQDTTSQKQVIH